MGKSVSALLHYLRPLVQHQVGFSPGNGDLLCKAETAGLSSSFVRVGDADRLPGDAGVFTQQLPLPKVMGQGGVVLLTDVGKGGSVVVEPQLEGDGSLSNVLLGLITTQSLGFVDKGCQPQPDPPDQVNKEPIAHPAPDPIDDQPIGLTHQPAASTPGPPDDQPADLPEQVAAVPSVVLDEDPKPQRKSCRRKKLVSYKL